MSFACPLKGEIEEALEHGDKRAAILMNGTSVEGLKSKFGAVRVGVKACLDNFDKDLFFERENDKKTKAQLKIMLLGAFSGVETLERLEDEIDRQTDTRVFRKESSELHDSLLRAVSMYKTRGKSDVPEHLAEQVIINYHHTHPYCAA